MVLSFMGIKEVTLDVDPSEFVGMHVDCVKDELLYLLMSEHPGFDFDSDDLMRMAREVAARGG